MNIAEKKRENNISEYIIFMYQTEDLMRVYHFDKAEVSQYVIEHFPIKPEEKEEVALWYDEVIRKMKAEGIEEYGHLAEVQKIVQELSSLSKELIRSDKTYRNIYDQAKLYIQENITLSKGEVTDEVQICLNGIYGLLLLRINGKQPDPSLQPAINAFGDMLSYLSYKYKVRNSINSN